MSTAAGPNLCGTAANFNDGGTTAWSNPTNAQGAQNGTVATATLLHGTTSQRLRCQGFGFAIPAGATVVGIMVEIFSSSADANLDESSVLLLRNIGSGVTGEVGTDKSTGAALGAAGWKSYGGPTDLWGLSVTPATINSILFGVSFKAVENGVSGTGTANVDAVRITVYYSTSVSATIVIAQSSTVKIKRAPATIHKTTQAYTVKLKRTLSLVRNQSQAYAVRLARLPSLARKPTQANTVWLARGPSTTRKQTQASSARLGRSPAVTRRASQASSVRVMRLLAVVRKVTEASTAALSRRAPAASRTVAQSNSVRVKRAPTMALGLAEACAARLSRMTALARTMTVRAAPRLKRAPTAASLITEEPTVRLVRRPVLEVFASQEQQVSLAKLAASVRHILAAMQQGVVVTLSRSVESTVKVEQAQEVAVRRSVTATLARIAQSPVARFFRARLRVVGTVVQDQPVGSVTQRGVDGTVRRTQVTGEAEQHAAGGAAHQAQAIGEVKQ